MGIDARFVFLKSTNAYCNACIILYCLCRSSVNYCLHQSLKYIIDINYIPSLLNVNDTVPPTGKQLQEQSTEIHVTKK